MSQGDFREFLETPRLETSAFPKACEQIFVIRSAVLLLEMERAVIVPRLPEEEPPHG